MKLLRVAAATAAALLPTALFAAGTTTGVEAGFSNITTTLTTLVNGAGGYLILIISIVVAAVTLMATGRWTYVITAVAVSLFLGYGIDIVSSMGGVTATIDMVGDAASVAATVGTL
jgi:predicted transporter